MYLAVDESTSPVLVRKTDELARKIEELFELDYQITRKDDWSLVRAYHALREVTDNNRKGPRS